MVVEVKPASVAQSTINQTDNVTCHICGNQMQALKTMQDAIIYECINCGPESDTLIFKPVESLSKPERILSNNSRQESNNMNMENKLFHQKQNNPRIYNNRENELLLLFQRNNLSDRRGFEKKILHYYRNILTKNSLIDIYLYFLDKGATTSREIRRDTKLSTSYVFESIKQLTEYGLIVPICHLKTGEKMGGAPTTLYGLPETTDQEIQQASSRYMRSFTKLYIFVEELYQRTFYEVRDEEIQYQKIAQICKNKKISGFHFLDVADEITRRFTEKGIKVWR